MSAIFSFNNIIALQSNTLNYSEHIKCQTVFPFFPLHIKYIKKFPFT